MLRHTPAPTARRSTAVPPTHRLSPRRAPFALAAALLLALPATSAAQDVEQRPRARDIGLRPGIFEPGPHNAITDVGGVRVGQVTVREGERVRTGVTAILPHGENPYLSRVPAAMYVGNGYGKLIGVTQVRELGEIESPILLTCTLCVWKVADATVEWMLERDGMDGVRSLNVVVGETNDGGLNDIRARPVEPEHVWRALESADGGAVEEGSVGAGTGTRAFGWKGGIGTSSRVLPEGLGGWSVGVLVQTNFGGILTMGGAPVGRELGRYSFQGAVAPSGEASSSTGRRDDPRLGSTADHPDRGDGSVMIVVATDAPLDSRNLERLAARAIMGLARTGSFAGNGSGDYVIAFSNAPAVRRDPGQDGPRTITVLPNDEMSPLFQAVVEATEEAIYNSLLKATTVSGMGRTADALPLEPTLEVLRRYNVIEPAGG